MVRIAAFDATALPLNTYSHLAVIVDENTRKHCYPRIREQLPEHICIEVPSGEEHKNLRTCQQIWEAMTAARLDRKSLVLNLGGGVIGDMGGFCAATYQRGIDFIQLPTSLLAQVDASIGGKLGIDFKGLKNHIGLFREPHSVWIDPRFLDTLPRRELRSGFAEIVKHCLIADREMWDNIRENPLSEQDFATLIAHSVEIKKAIVAADPQEKGQRKLLNFGHTIGHAIETFFMESPDHDRILHGEAIAAGMIAESWLSWQRKMLSEAHFDEVQTYIREVFGSIPLSGEVISSIIGYARHDKKNERQKILASLLSEHPGQAVFNVAISEEDIREALRAYRELSP